MPTPELNLDSNPEFLADLRDGALRNKDISEKWGCSNGYVGDRRARLRRGEPIDAREAREAAAIQDGDTSEVTTNSETLHLGKGETGFASDTGRTVRPLTTPLFLEFDRTPKPNSTNPMLQAILNETVNRPANQCR